DFAAPGPVQARTATSRGERIICPLVMRRSGASPTKGDRLTRGSLSRLLRRSILRLRPFSRAEECVMSEGVGSASAGMAAQGLYDPAHEHDACGVGFVAHIKGRKAHAIIEQGLKILENLDHRGAVGADKLMGDGAGVLIQLPDLLYREEMAKQGATLPPPGEYGVGMIFLPKEHASREACEQELERTVRAEGQLVLGWRDVRVDGEMPMSPAVKAREPVIRQLFIGRGPDIMVP